MSNGIFKFVQINMKHLLYKPRHLEFTTNISFFRLSIVQQNALPDSYQLHILQNLDIDAFKAVICSTHVLRFLMLVSFNLI